MDARADEPFGSLRQTPGVWGQSPRAGQTDRLASEPPGEKKQLIDRLPPEFIAQTLESFNDGRIDAAAAMVALGIGRSRLYEMRTTWLRDREGFQPVRSGGNRHRSWPPKVLAFLQEFLPLQRPPNFQLVADEMERLLGFKRARSTVEAYVKKHLPDLVLQTERKKRSYRRFRRAHIGELWQHDSSIHQWWPGKRKQTLLLTTDDHSGLFVAGRFVESDTTWNHFGHFRAAFEQYGIPESIYTDALSLFGPSSTYDNVDPKSQFQRALLGMGVAHLVAPTPQAKGKIERSFGTFQNRLVTLLTHAEVTEFEEANKVLAMEIARQNGKRRRSTAKIPHEVWEEAGLHSTSRMRCCPDHALLDLHFSLRCQRRVNNDSTIDFEGESFEIAPTQRKSVTIIHHPNQRFWVLEEAPKTVWTTVLGDFTL